MSVDIETQLDERLREEAKNRRPAIDVAPRPPRRSPPPTWRRSQRPTPPPPYSVDRYAGPFNTEAYDHLDENPFHRVAVDPLSTFSIDVDTASYATFGAS